MARTFERMDSLGGDIVDLDRPIQDVNGTEDNLVTVRVEECNDQKGTTPQHNGIEASPLPARRQFLYIEPVNLDDSSSIDSDKNESDAEHQKQSEFEETVHIKSEITRLDSAMKTDTAYVPEEIGVSDETAKFVQKHFGQLLELPQLLLNKSQLDIASLIDFSRELAKFPPPLKAKLGDIFPIETFTLLKSFLENLGLNLQQCIWTLLVKDESAEKFNRSVNEVIQNYCETLCPNFKIWQTFSAQKKYDTVLDSDYIKVLTKGPVLFADFYARVFEDLVSNTRDNKVKTDLQNLMEDYITKSTRKKSIKADLAATWQMIVQFLLLFKGAYSSLKKISPEVVSAESLQCIRNVCSFFETFTELTNLISALSVGFKTSESMMDHIKGWSSEQLSDMMKTPRAYIQSIRPRDLEFYPVPKKDKIRDSKATLYLFSDKLVVKVCKDGFSSQFLRGLGYHLPDIAIYSMKDIVGIQYGKATEKQMEQYSVPNNVPTPMVLNVDFDNAKNMEVVFKSGPDVPDQDKQSAQFVSFFQKLNDIIEFDLYSKCKALSAPSSLSLLNEIAKSWLRIRELEKIPEPILQENPGLLGEVSVEKFVATSKGGKRATDLGKKGVKGCKGMRMLIFTDSIFVTLVGQTMGISSYTIMQSDVSNFSVEWQNYASVSIVIESENLGKCFRCYPDIPKGPANVETKVVKDIKHFISCFNEIRVLRATEEQKLKELHVHAKDPELKANKR